MNFRKKYTPLILLIAIVTGYTGSKLIAQNTGKGPEIYLSPRITIGYTFGSGLNYGFDAVLGLYKVNDFKFGINFTYYMANTDQGHHRMKGLGVFGESKYFNLKLGAGAVSRRWGLRNVNKASAPGLMFDISGSMGEDYSPWIGVKSFIFNRERWQFYDHPSYLSIYTYFKSPDIVFYKVEENQSISQ